MATNQQTIHTRLQQAFRQMEKPANKDRLLVPSVMFEVDPYSAATHAFNKALDLAFQNNGAMAQVEYEILRQIEALLIAKGERYPERSVTGLAPLPPGQVEFES